ncbi:hypothetical protein [Janthinobacterium agaricidamnosum]|uniref:Uncharacterized protein n=1 Tax=Janthinobacterium agaricidamnosum NBRC 102515 = DSM 9628 TaxID=1349767 RepID=W0VA71_9BURK|nr:putative uncharacterized protein [Janthinobacterium agaricidamnosum NBRC 102515 = DSM 9628]
MAFNLYDSKGCPLEQQHFTWRELVQQPISKLDDDAYTRVRIILMNSIEHAALRFQHMASRLSGDLQLVLARIRRVEQQQAVMTGWLLGADHSPLETTIANEQAAIGVTAALAQQEPDAALAQSCRHTLLENVDHLYRYSALLDRLEGKDANNILQSYTDILPGRPTREQHRAPHDDLRPPYQRDTARPATKLHVLILNALAQRSRDSQLRGARKQPPYESHLGTFPRLRTGPFPPGQHAVCSA